MGYWYHINDANLHVPAANLDAVYDVCVGIYKDRAEIYGATPIPADLVEILTQHSIRVDVDPASGDLTVWGGESKYHSNFPFTAALLAFAPDGSYVIWQGEEGGDFVRQIVRDGRVDQQQGHVTFGG